MQADGEEDAEDTRHILLRKVVSPSRVISVFVPCLTLLARNKGPRKGQIQTQRWPGPTLDAG